MITSRQKESNKSEQDGLEVVLSVITSRLLENFELSDYSLEVVLSVITSISVLCSRVV